MTKKATIAPGIDSASVGVLIASPSDVGPMAKAREWVDAFTSNGVIVRSLGAFEALVGTMSEIVIEGREAIVPAATLTSAFGGLGAHTLIWVAPNYPNGRSLVLYSGVQDEELAIHTSDLADMYLEEIGGVKWVRHPQAASNNRLFQISLFLTVLRLSFYTQIYLCIIATRYRSASKNEKKEPNRPAETTELRPLATLLRDLTECTVYFNDVGIEFDEQGGLKAVVPSGDTLAAALGWKFTAETTDTIPRPPPATKDDTNAEPLLAAAGTFFHGSSQRV